MPTRQQSRQHIERAIEHAQAGHASFGKANEEASSGHESLDGFEVSTREIRRDRPGRIVASSGRALREKSDTTTDHAEESYAAQNQGLDHAAWAMHSLDQAWPTLPEDVREDVSRAWNLLDQTDEAAWTENHLATTLATLNGGADPYITAVEQDTPRTDVSYYAYDLHSLFSDSSRAMEQAVKSGRVSVDSVGEAITILQEVKKQLGES